MCAAYRSSEQASLPAAGMSGKPYLYSLHKVCQVNKNSGAEKIKPAGTFLDGLLRILVNPAVYWTFKAKSSATKEVARELFSAPIKYTWMVWPLYADRLNVFKL